MGYIFQTSSRLKKIVIYSISTYLLLAGSCMLGTHPKIGWFPESNFEISPDSRLPRWFPTPQGYVRKDLTVRIYYYSPLFGKINFKAILLGPLPGNKTIDEKYGQTRWHPSMKKKKNKFGGFNPDSYPHYTIDEIDDIKEVIEQRKMEPILYVSDDPELRKEMVQK